MAESFPDSRFVLTRRTSAAVWFKSQRHHIKKYGPHRGIYGDMTEKEAPEKYQAFYENHLVEARSFFADTDRLLEVCWDDGDGWEQLCPFLGRPIPDIAFPHSNPTPTFSRRVKTRIHALREVRRRGPTSVSPRSNRYRQAEVCRGREDGSPRSVGTHLIPSPGASARSSA